MSRNSNLYNNYLPDMAISKEDLEDIKKVTFSILKDFHNMCEEAEIKYSLALKTLLGAVTYNDFIPGDDIIRVFIKEDDYDKLKKIVSTKYPSKYTFLDKDIDKNYTLPNPRLVRLDTLIIEATGDNRPDACGVYIDLYLLRKAPIENREIKNATYKKYLEITNHLCDYKFPSKTIRQRAKNNPKLKALFNKNRTEGFFYSMFPIKFWCWLRDKNLLGKEDEKQYVVCTKRLDFIDKELFNELELCDFCGEKFYITKNHERLLKQLYGEYNLEEFIKDNVRVLVEFDIKDVLKEIENK